jgi:hypothetical protein
MPSSWTTGTTGTTLTSGSGSALCDISFSKSLRIFAILEPDPGFSLSSVSSSSANF